MRKLFAAVAAALLCCPTIIAAQSAPPAYTPMTDGTNHASTPSYTYCWSGTAWVGCSPSGGGGSGGAVTLIDGADTTLGSKADGPASAFDTTPNSLIALTKAVAAYLKTMAGAAADTTTPQPVSQSGAWSVGLTGSLPGFASAPTVNLGTLNGAATASAQASILAALGTPYQAGGALPLPSGAATATAQASLLAALGSPYQAGGALPLPAGAATATGQATNTAAITVTQAAAGTIAGTSQTVTMVIPQLTSIPRGGVFGTTATQLMPANASRHFIQVQVQSSTAACYINGSNTATADYNSLMIPSNNTFESSSHVGTGAISIICTAANVPVYAREG